MSSDNDAQIAEMWEQEEAKTLEQRRSKYDCKGNYVTPDKVHNWEQFATRYKLKSTNPAYPINSDLNRIIALYQGNITALEVDAIQNAANKSLLGGGGIDGAIHRAAGKKLVGETILLNGCETGETKISRGYNLPAKYVLHTVGPIGVKPPLLKSCYRTSLELAKKHQLRSIALCGVSTGVYGYPVEQACPVVLKTIRKWLLENENYLSFDKIIFVQFADREMEVYKSQLPIYFPVIITQKDDEDSLLSSPPPPPPPGVKIGNSDAQPETKKESNPDQSAENKESAEEQKEEKAANEDHKENQAEAENKEIAEEQKEEKAVNEDQKENQAVVVTEGKEENESLGATKDSDSTTENA